MLLPYAAVLATDNPIVDEQSIEQLGLQGFAASVQDPGEGCAAGGPPVTASDLVSLGWVAPGHIHTAEAALREEKLLQGSLLRTEQQRLPVPATQLQQPAEAPSHIAPAAATWQTSGPQAVQSLAHALLIADGLTDHPVSAASRHASQAAAAQHTFMATVAQQGHVGAETAAGEGQNLQNAASAAGAPPALPGAVGGHVPSLHMQETALVQAPAASQPAAAASEGSAQTGPWRTKRKAAFPEDSSRQALPGAPGSQAERSVGPKQNVARAASEGQPQARSAALLAVTPEDEDAPSKSSYHGQHFPRQAVEAPVVLPFSIGHQQNKTALEVQEPSAECQPSEGCRIKQAEQGGVAQDSPPCLPDQVSSLKFNIVSAFKRTYLCLDEAAADLQLFKNARIWSVLHVYQGKCLAAGARAHEDV